MMEELKRDLIVKGYGGCPDLAEISVGRVDASLVLRGIRVEARYPSREFGTGAEFGGRFQMTG